MKWFGESWNGYVCEQKRHAKTPVGDACIYCKEHIKENDRGLLIPRAFQDDSTPEESIWHLDCFLKSIIGA